MIMDVLGMKKGNIEGEWHLEGEILTRN